jgi:UDP-glucose 4-epimerase
VYGQPKRLPVDEDHETHPIDVNGIHKLAAEQHHQLYHSYHGLPTVCLRLTNTYGPRQLIRHSRQGFVGWFFNRALTGQPIQLFGGGQQVRDFTFVDDVSEALIAAARTPACAGGVYNLGGVRASLAEVSAQLAVLSKGRTSIEPIPFPAAQKKIDIGDYYGSYRLFEEATGWRPAVGLREGLALTYDYFAKNLTAYLP